MTPEEVAYCVLNDCDRRDQHIKRILDDNYHLLTEEHERRLRDDPEYAARWHAGIKAFADCIDEQIAAQVYNELYKP